MRKPRYVLKSLLLALAGASGLFGCMSGGGAQQMDKTSTDAGHRGEKELEQLVVAIAETGLSNLEEIARISRLSFTESASAAQPSSGWRYYEGSPATHLSVLKRVSYRVFLEPEADGLNRRKVSSSKIDLEFKDDICLSGKSLLEKYASNNPADYANVWGEGPVFPLRIAGRDVFVHYRADKQCVKKVFM
jgi:hypothetical protein